MTTAQKIIKYFAIALAFSIILGILSCIMYGLSTISNFFSDKDNSIENLKDIDINSSLVSILDIDILSSNLIIKEGDVLKIETNSEYITTNQNNNKIIIKEKKHNWFIKNDKSDLIVYIPKNFVFDGISIDAGAGKIEIENISTKILEFDLGAGKTTIDNLYVSGSAEIDGGAGEITIQNSSINNLDLDTGIGECSLVSKLIGKSEINMGVGKLDITLIGSIDDYRIYAEKGIGSIKLNNESIKSNKSYGNGINSIDISGGIGSINVILKNEI